MNKVISTVAVLSAVLVGFLAPVQGAHTPKGSIVIAVTSLADEPIDPAKTKTDIDRPITESLGEGLATANHEGQIIPSLAESWRLVPGTENLGWEFKLRKGVKFWDGTEVTAEDVKFSIERAKDPKTGSQSGPFLRDNIDRVEVVDAHTLMIYSPKPSPWVPPAAGGRATAAIPKAYYEKVGEEAFNTVEKLVTAGEFRPVEHKRMQYLVMEANESFFDPERVPRVKRIKLASVPELATRLAMLQTGEADIIGEINGPAVSQVQADPKNKIAASKMTACYYLAAADLIHPEPSPVKDKRVRLALALAIDVDSIIKKIYFGEADPAVAFMYDYDAGYDPELKPRGYDFEKAKKLLAEAGYANGFEVDLQGALTPSTPRCDKVLEAVAGMWQKLGVKVNLNIMEAGTYYAKYREKVYRGFCAMSAPAIWDSLVTMYYMAYTNMMYSYYSNPQMDQWIDAQKTELDPQKRAKIARNIWHHWYDELVGINIIHPRALYGMGPKIKEWRTIAHQPYAVGLEYITPAD